ncbi:MAG TPA: transglycosylase SLT domain-containing protein [Coxiellaceae bacterium]|nr:transglycosylase SLT domain-containing protein [Coxiellaceae bacterium]
MKKGWIVLTMGLMLGMAEADTTLSEEDVSQQLVEVAQTVQNQTNQVDREAADSSANLFEQLSQNFQLAVEAEQPRIETQRQFWLQHMDLLQHACLNATPYLYYIFQEASARHMPAEVALIPMIESAYNPNAYSTMGASGLWQIMPATAVSRGVTINWWFDGRKDLLFSTQAALNYLQKLHLQFHDWLLAIAAYDAGEGVVQAAIERNQREHRETDFWSLDLPTETQLYVPRLLALAQMIQRPTDYDIHLPLIPNKPYFVSIPVHFQITWDELSRLTGLAPKQLKRLNAGFLRWASEPNKKTHLLVPYEVVERFRVGLEERQGHPQKRWVFHQVQPGETLHSIARSYHVNETLLKTANPVLANKPLEGFEGLLVPLNLHDSSREEAAYFQPKSVLVDPPETSLPHSAIQSSDSLEATLNKLYGQE